MGKWRLHEAVPAGSWLEREGETALRVVVLVVVVAVVVVAVVATRVGGGVVVVVVVVTGWQIWKIKNSRFFRSL